MVDVDENADHERRYNSRRDVVVVGVRDAVGRMLMTRTHRLPGVWQPVAGGIESADRSPAEAAVRELREELALRVDASCLHGFMETRYDLGDGTIFFFMLDGSFTDDDLTINPDEIAEHRWVTVAEAIELPAFDATATFLAELRRRERG